uniref:Uncharacterized protein n=1 Tax=Pyramimonas obovata TaxID=1411642 RepID=A0A7S0N8C8_9CHLO|mmetsp:Transcript_22800/g.49990  ORF Transcript_22800/g.49990 Transcript_22800/m.49990 type:complete len:645 (+) Transcript_22800:134-2068(+)
MTRMDNPRSWLAPVFGITLLVLPTSSIEQCSICDDIALRHRCLKEFPGRKFAVCPVEGRYALLDRQAWQCYEKPRMNPWSKDLWNTLELRPVHSPVFDFPSSTPAHLLRNRTFSNMDLVAYPNRHAVLSDACWDGHGEEGRKGCRAFIHAGARCNLECHTGREESCNMISPHEKAKDKDERALPGPSACLLYRGFGEGLVTPRIKWMKPSSEFCRFGSDVHHGWYKWLPSPWMDVPDLATYHMEVLSKFGKNESYTLIKHQCDGLIAALRRAFFAEYPFESGAHQDPGYTPHLRNTFDSAQTHLVRVEVYRYSKRTVVRHGHSGAAVFAGFSPASSAHTLRTFRIEAGEMIAEEAAKCYALTGVKFVAIQSPGAWGPEMMELTSAEVPNWPHMDLLVSKRPGPDPADLDAQKKHKKPPCDAHALFASWTMCYGDDELQRPTILDKDEMPKKPWLPAQTVKQMKTALAALEVRQASGGVLSGVKERHVLRNLWHQQRVSSLLDADFDEQDAYVTPLVALLLLMIAAGLVALLYKTWLAILPYLEPVQVALNRHRNRDRKPRFVPRIYQSTPDFKMPERVAFGAALVPDALAQHAQAAASSFAQGPVTQSLASVGTSIQSSVAEGVAKLQPGQRPGRPPAGQAPAV